MAAVDPKVVTIDSYVLGYRGSTDRAVYGRVVSISAHGWIVVWTDNPGPVGGQQAVMYPGRFVVKDAPRPERQRDDIPERFRR